MKLLYTYQTPCDGSKMAVCENEKGEQKLFPYFIWLEIKKKNTKNSKKGLF